MAQDTEIERLKEHRNAFGFLRLLFASLVIVSHTPEIKYGNRSREILTQIFGTISFGELAVDGFFTISGYLIVGSFLKKPHFWPYLKKRLARIYPGFIVATIIALLIVAPVAGGNLHQLLFSARGVFHALFTMLTLQGPKIPGTFQGNHNSALNGAMWTIAYEFRCYLLVLVLGLTGALRRPWLIAVLAVALLCAYEILPATIWLHISGIIPHTYPLLGVYAWNARLMGIFLFGSLFYLKKDSIKFTIFGCFIATVIMIVFMFEKHLAEIGVATCGAYLIFAIAQFGKSGIISKINNKNDISYGVYLYAWPTEQLIVWYFPDLPLFYTGMLTFIIACLCGWLSWHALEKPVMMGLRAGRGRKLETEGVAQSLTRN